MPTVFQVQHTSRVQAASGAKAQAHLLAGISEHKHAALRDWCSHRTRQYELAFLTLHQGKRRVSRKTTGCPAIVRAFAKTESGALDPSHLLPRRCQVPFPMGTALLQDV